MSLNLQKLMGVKMGDINNLEKVDNGDALFDGYFNDSIFENMKITGLNTIRAVEGDGGVFSKHNLDCFADSFASTENGKLSTINATNTTALYSENDNSWNPTYTDIAGNGTTHDPDSVTNPTYFYDGNDSTSATKNYTGSPGGVTTLSTEFGETFTAKTIGYATFSASISGSAGSGNITSKSISLQTYNGSTWSTEYSKSSTVDSVGISVFNQVVELNKSVQGIRVVLSITRSQFGASPYDITHNFTEIEYGEAMITSIVSMDIPSGQTPATISALIGVAMIDNFETGSSINFKIKNSGGDDSGWLSIDTPILNNITQFSSEPDELQIQLIPKSSSPTHNNPSIRGAFIFGK